MVKINKIAVLCGGSSSEREISLQSGEGVHNAICDLGYESDLIDFKNLSNFNELKIYDFIFIVLHGFEGEGGKLQKELDDLNIRYSGSGSKACANTWNKKITKEILKENNINTPISIDINEFSDQIAKSGLNISSYDCFRPFNHLFLKPEADGSSIDIFKISDDESLKNAYKKCTNPKRGFLFEEYIDLYPNGYNPYDSMGEFYYNEGDLENAKYFYNKAAENFYAASTANERLKELNQN